MYDGVMTISIFGLLDTFLVKGSCLEDCMFLDHLIAISFVLHQVLAKFWLLIVLILIYN
jgi:hypothetical protein